MQLPALWEHQKKAINASFELPDVALFYDPGTGKTRTTIDIIRHRCAANGRLMKIFVLCPKIVCTNWKREFAQYSKIHPWDVVILKGTGHRRKKDFIEAVSDNGILSKPKIIITNYEALQMEELFNLIKTWAPEIIVGDEAQRFKSPTSVRAKKATELADLAKHKYVLTGSPILKDAQDIFQIFRFLDRGQTFGTNFWKFRQVWFEDENAQWMGKPNYFAKWVPRPETYAEFYKMIYKKALRAVKSECLDLPPFVRKEVHVEMSKEQERLYKEMKAEYVAYIDDITKTDTPRAVVAQMAITKALRLQQIVTGFAKTDDGDIYRIKDNPRLDALEELLEDLAPDHKVIVWSVFHENYADIKSVCEKLGLDYTELHGKVPQKDRDANIDRFNNDEKCRVLVANPAAGGVGINLVSSDIAIFYSKGFGLEADIQAEARNYRGGSERHLSVTRIDIIATDTIDDLISQSLQMKQNIATQILDWKESQL